MSTVDFPDRRPEDRDESCASVDAAERDDARVGGEP
jgi:hypothetical protein